MQAISLEKLIKILNLSSNRLGCQSSEAVRDLLKLNRNITKLDLSCNNLSQQGGLNIMEGLKYNTSITYLDVRWGRPARPIIRAESRGSISRLTGVEKIVDIAVQNVLQKNNGFGGADKANNWAEVIIKIHRGSSEY